MVCWAARISTKPPPNGSKAYVLAMCRWRLTELNWVSTKIRFRPEWMQLEIGMSIRRYLPAIGTAGLLRDLVSGNRRVPRPPPRIRLMILGIETLPPGRPAAPGDNSVMNRSHKANFD